MKPVVAIIGRPNAGKSTLFNRITGTRDALVDDLPGVTRDRHYGSASWNGVSFTVIDTGGFSSNDASELSALSREQMAHAIAHAHAVILLFDGKSGLSPFDDELLKLLRGKTFPIFYTVNKIDGPDREKDLYEFHRLGVETLYPVSAEHGYGVSDLLDDLVDSLPEFPAEEPTEMVKLAVIGRPNVGKSSLVNRIIGENRMIVSQIPGTTRDSIDTPCLVKEKSYLLIDTAGIRRKKSVSAKIEKFSIIKTLQSINRCDIALILLDAAEGITEQDIKIAGYAFEQGCGCIFLINKWDLVQKKSEAFKKLTEDLRIKAKYLSFAPVIPISALTGKRVLEIFDAVEEVYEQYSRRIATGPLNQIINRATEKTEPSLYKGKRLKFYYATQIANKPPAIACFVNFPEGVHFSYQRYLINQIREQTGLDKTPIRLFLRQRREPAAGARPQKKGGRTRQIKTRNPLPSKKTRLQ